MDEVQSIPQQTASTQMAETELPQGNARTADTAQAPEASTGEYPADTAQAPDASTGEHPADTAQAPEASTPEITTPAGMGNDYRFIRALGQGAQSKVFLAERLSDHQKVAIKQLRIDSIKTWKEYTLFHREAEVLATLDIPGVVKLYEARDCIEDEPPCSYIVQEYIEGPTLKQILSSGYRFSLTQIFDLILQLIQILKKLHCHEPPVIHRDIKPSNIILRHWEGGNFKASLLDFGAVSNPQVQSGGSTIAGTFGYMSPEQLIGRAEPASDTYALAALLAYLLSGVDPAEMTVIDLRLIIDPYVESQPRALVQMLRQMLEPSLDKRLSDLDKIQSRILNFQDNHYELDLDQDNAPNPQAFKEQLLEVRHLCQPHNMALWQSLPDDPAKRPDLKNLFVTQPRFKDYPAAIPSESLTPLIIEIFAILIFIGITALVIQTGDSAFIGIVIVALVLTWPFLYYPGLWLRNCISKPKLSSIRSEYRKSPQSSPDHLSLYNSGHKAIAIITNIRFIKCESWEVNTEFHYEHPRVEIPPTYVLTYKFNPPDDDKTQDIFHSITIHTDPEKLFKRGDPLPILYQTRPGTFDRPPHVTRSMPFPFPLCDLNEPTDYISNKLNP